MQVVAAAILLTVALGPPAVFAQGTGTVRGTVANPAGEVVANATIQARAPDGTTVRRASSDSNGRYSLTDLPPGSYEISVNVPGLRAFSQRDVVVRSGADALLDIRLQEGTQLSTLGEDPRGIAADQARRAPPAGPAPRTAGGKPDLSGVWWAPVVVEPGKPEWLPDAQKVAAERQANNRRDSPQLRCLPSAVLRRGPLVEFVQSETKIIEISDDDSPGFHHIYLNRGHPREQDPLWYGDSVGRWEGDTLVVDRNNFVQDVWLDQEGHPHSDKLHVVERYRRLDLGHLEVEITVEDPAVLAAPWTFTRVSELAPSEEIREFVCENNTDLLHFVGK